MLICSKPSLLRCAARAAIERAMAGNVDLYRALHTAEASYGTTANELTPYILPFAREVNPRRILDYGCGKSQICRELAGQVGAEAVLYDPAISALSAKPDAPCDFAINNDVLEHIPEDQLDDIIADIKSLAPKAVFTISVALADAILENGENAHCTVRTPEWWQARLTKHYGEAYRVPTFVSTACAFATWKPSAETMRAAETLAQNEESRRRSNREFAKVKNAFRLMMQPPLGRDELLAKLDGKSVALVGNAAGLAQKELGAEIDAHDIVVRFNGALIPHIRSHGRKTDWVATEIPFTHGTAKSRGVNTVLWLAPDRDQLSAWMVRRKDTELYVQARAHDDAIEAVAADLVLGNPKVKAVSLYGVDGKARAAGEQLASRDSRLAV
jgi:hypothetical protein